jgi:hypothetical protein
VKAAQVPCAAFTISDQNFTVTLAE